MPRHTAVLPRNALEHFGVRRKFFDEHQETLNLIRRGLAGHKPEEAIQRLLMFVKKFPTNAEMLKGIPG